MLLWFTRLLSISLSFFVRMDFNSGEVVVGKIGHDLPVT